ncbi:hypothetical protein TNCV_5023261 [Trichonephila clavipes]|nr:hypothetical protein TNCV_5023261 [Trichonephila clavipes]
MGAMITNALQPGALLWFEKTQGAPSEGATCAWIAADEAVGYTRVFLKMGWSSRRLVCPGRPKSCLHVIDMSRIQCPNTSSQYNQSGLIDQLLA